MKNQSPYKLKELNNNYYIKWFNLNLMIKLFKKMRDINKKENDILKLK